MSQLAQRTPARVAAEDALLDAAEQLLVEVGHAGMTPVQGAVARSGRMTLPGILERLAPSPAWSVAHSLPTPPRNPTTLPASARPCGRRRDCRADALAGLSNRIC